MTGNKNNLGERLQEGMQAFLEAIPYYPTTITRLALCRATGIAYRRLDERLKQVQYFALLIEDEGLVSKMKEDLSNCV